MNEEFSIDNLKPFFEVTGGKRREREYFQTRLTFPIERKDAVMRYLRKNKKRIVKEIIEQAESAEE